MPVAPDLCGIALEDRYELHELIGEGAFGRVYRGHDRRLQRAVAVKVIKPWWAEDPEWIATFEHETRMLARLSDPGIVQIHDVGQADEGLFYVSELVEGENLATRLRRAGGGGLPVAEARRIALGLCRALAGAHAQRIVHRDVKPANVLLGDGATPVKVGDFGIARLAEATTHGGNGPHPSLVVGTPRYMAPEQGRGGPTTPATDVYSVGAVLYEMLAGRPPFAGDSSVALALSHLNDPPPPLPAAVPDELRRIVMRALAKDPAARYPDAGAMATALSAARSGRAGGALGGRPRVPVLGADPRDRVAAADGTLPAPRRGPRTTVDPAARRRSVALLGLAGALLGALVVAAIVVGDRHGSPARAAAAPRRVEVPLLVGENGTDARARLRSLGLRTTLVPVPAPGIAPGTVTSQHPLAGHTAVANASVRLSVSEVPRWRTVTAFSGRDSVAFRIRGERWRILASVDSATHCAVLGLFCHSTHATVLRRASGDSTVTSVGLGDGDAQAHVFGTGPGIYRVSVDPASSSTRWTLRVQDDY